MSSEKFKTIYTKNNQAELYLLCLIVSVCWFLVYLIVQLRYAPLHPDSNTLTKLLSPFFSDQYVWSDWYGAMWRSENLTPYADRYGNSPPLLAAFFYVISVLDKSGVRFETTLLISWMISCAAIAGSVFCCGRSNGFSISVVLKTAFITVFTYPALYCFDRGNSVLFVAPIIAAALVLHKNGKTYLSAVLIGIAAAFKIYPAVLGCIFLAKKEWKQAFVCFITGVLATVIPLFFFEGGFVYSLKSFIEKLTSYGTTGNGKIAWLVDDKNSFFQLFLVPRMMTDPLTSIEAVGEYLEAFRPVIWAFSAVTALLSLTFASEANRVLLLTMLMLGVPAESGVYNLIYILFPISAWVFDKDNRPSIVTLLAAVGLFTMKSFISVNPGGLIITPQAILNPLLEIIIIVSICFSERTAIRNGLDGLKKKKAERTEPAENMITAEEETPVHGTDNMAGFICALLGFDVILMVIANAGAPKWVNQLIYGFHMPLFFAVSGYAFDEEKWKEKGFKALARGKADTYVKPYFMYSLLSLLLCVPVIITGDKAVKGLGFVKKTASMIGWTLYGYTTAGKTEWGPLWLLPCIFIASVLFFLFISSTESTEKRILTGIAVFVVERFLVQFKQIPLPWHADVAILCVLFMFVGYEIRKTDVLDSGIIGKGGMIVLLIFAIWAIAENGYCLDLNNNRLGTSSIAGFTAASTMTLVLMFAAKKIEKTLDLKPLKFLGRNCIWFIAFNACLNSYTARIWNRIPYLNKVGYRWWIKTAVVIAVITVMILIKEKIVKKIEK